MRIITAKRSFFSELRGLDGIVAAVIFDGLLLLAVFEVARRLNLTGTLGHRMSRHVIGRVQLVQGQLERLSIYISGRHIES